MCHVQLIQHYFLLSTLPKQFKKILDYSMLFNESIFDVFTLLIYYTINSCVLEILSWKNV